MMAHDIINLRFSSFKSFPTVHYFGFFFFPGANLACNFGISLPLALTTPTLPALVGPFF